MCPHGPLAQSKPPWPRTLDTGLERESTVWHLSASPQSASQAQSSQSPPHSSDASCPRSAGLPVADSIGPIRFDTLPPGPSNRPSGPPATSATSLSSVGCALSPAAAVGPGASSPSRRLERVIRCHIHPEQTITTLFRRSTDRHKPGHLPSSDRSSWESAGGNHSKSVIGTCSRLLPSFLLSYQQHIIRPPARLPTSISHILFLFGLNLDFRLSTSQNTIYETSSRSSKPP